MGSDLFAMANAIRSLAVDAIQSANSGHAGMVLGMADVVTVLFARFLKFNPMDPKWQDRDRFLLSAGHGSMLIYAVLYLTGYKDITLEDLKHFRQLGSCTPGHPEYESLLGIESTSGPLGQGFANAVGMAIAEEILSAKLNSRLVNHYTYVVVGDGCLMEGIGYESASIAGHLRLSKLVVLFDCNSISIDGGTDLACSEDHLKLFEAFGWHVQAVDGHCYDSIELAIAAARDSDKPSLIAFKTIIGKFMSYQSTASAHSGSVKYQDLMDFKDALGLLKEPFAVDSQVLSIWRGLGVKSAQHYDVWQQEFASSCLKERQVLSGRLDGDLISSQLDLLKRRFDKNNAQNRSEEATRASSGRTLEVLYKCIDGLIGGSADLTISNNTKVVGMEVVRAGNFNADYIHYGVREHLMAACMNGMALHGGIIPYGGTFFVFTDYCRPAIRLSALMNIKVIYVMTHDSIGVGEDGPTHQPVEHLASLRAMPGLYVIRPADIIETIESWELALMLDGPVVLVFSRQKVPQIRDYTASNRVATGGYVVCEASNVKELQITLFATGSELSLAIGVKKVLCEKYNLSIRVVSLPCWELFFQQSLEYREEIIENDSLKIAIEAASSFGWDKIIGKSGKFIGVERFGSSAPSKDLYTHFGLDIDKIVNLCEEYMGL